MVYLNKMFEVDINNIKEIIIKELNKKEIKTKEDLLIFFSQTICFINHNLED